tara:strand:+ start:1890 stop:2528 length:639 start_codon:yes stop_codon:yes gene_type:complete
MKIKIIFLISLSSLIFSNDFIIKERSIADSLPTNMPIVKKVFWGEKGLLRDSFVDPKSRIKELEIRRNMLQLHQRFALITLGALMYQTSIGFKMTEDGEYQKYKDTHMKLGYISFGTYMTAASLSIFAPPGMKYSKKKFSSNKLHRYLAIIHFTGMAMQPWLGYKTSVANINCANRVAGACEESDNLTNLHKNVGTITVSSYFLAFLTTLFK